MGDPRKRRKTYTTPAHPWQAQAIAAEHKLRKEYGLKTSTELYKVEAKLRKYRGIARQLIGGRGKEVEEKRKILANKLIRIGVLNVGAKLEDVLALDVRDLLERRLQTLVYKKGLAKTSLDARKHIVYGHISFRGRVHTAPSTLVDKDDEDEIAYIGPVPKISTAESKEAPMLSKATPKKEVEVEVE